MRRLISIITLGLFYLTGAAGANAQEVRPYIGIAGGIFAVQYEESGPAYLIKQRNPTAGGYLKAGIDVNEYIGGELRFGLTGNPSTEWPVGTLGSPAPFTVSTKIDHFISYLLKVGTPVGTNAHIHVYLGGTTAKFNGELSIVGLNFGQNASKTGFTYGFGLDYSVTETVKLGLEWTEYWTNVNLGASAGSSAKGSFRGVTANMEVSF